MTAPDRPRPPSAVVPLQLCRAGRRGLPRGKGRAGLGLRLRVQARSAPSPAGAAVAGGSSGARSSWKGGPTHSRKPAARARPRTAGPSQPAGAPAPQQDSWTSRGRPSQRRSSRVVSVPGGSPERPRTASSRQRRVAPTSSSSVASTRWQARAQTTVGSGSDCSRPPPATLTVVRSSEIAPPGPGCATVAAAPPTRSRAPGPTSTWRSSSSPPSGPPAVPTRVSPSIVSRSASGAWERSDSRRVRPPGPAPATTCARAFIGPGR